MKREKQNASVVEKVSSNLVANIFDRSLSKRSQSTLPVDVPIQSSTAEKQNKKLSPVELKFNTYMNYLKASDMPNDEKVRKGTKAFLKLEAFLNKKKQPKQKEQPEQDDEMLKQQQHKYYYDLIDDNYKHIGIIIKKITDEYKKNLVGTIPKEIIDYRKDLDFRLDRYTTNVLKFFDIIQNKLGEKIENIEVHLYNIEKIKKAIADRELGGWGQQRADSLQRE